MPQYSPVVKVFLQYIILFLDLLSKQTKMVLGKEVHMQIMYLRRTKKINCVASDPKNKRKEETTNEHPKRCWANRITFISFKNSGCLSHLHRYHIEISESLIFKNTYVFPLHYCIHTIM